MHILSTPCYSANVKINYFMSLPGNHTTQVLSSGSLDDNSPSKDDGNNGKPHCYHIEVHGSSLTIHYLISTHSTNSCKKGLAHGAC